MAIAVVTAAAARGSDEDESLLMSALSTLGADASVVAWDDPAVQWAAFKRVVVRSTWDHALRREEFLGWAQGVAEVTELLNSAAVLRWNTDRTYLRELTSCAGPASWRGARS